MLFAVFLTILFVFGLWWCRDVYDRFPSDVACLKESNTFTEKFVIVFYWVLTVGILALMICLAIYSIANLIENL